MNVSLRDGFLVLIANSPWYYVRANMFKESDYMILSGTFSST